MANERVYSYGTVIDYHAVTNLTSDAFEDGAMIKNGLNVQPVELLKRRKKINTVSTVKIGDILVKNARFYDFTFIQKIQKRS